MSKAHKTPFQRNFLQATKMESIEGVIPFDLTKNIFYFCTAKSTKFFACIRKKKISCLSFLAFPIPDYI